MTSPGFDDGTVDDEHTRPTYTVSELADAINRQLRDGFSDGVWVRGEIDNFRTSGAHSYFTLAEATGTGRAVLNVSLFAPAKRTLTPLLKRHRLELGNGTAVRVFGRLDYYAPGGRLGLVMSDLDPRFTLGELSLARDQVIRRLIADGLYDANRATTMPAAPLRVGVVTSLQSAAWEDFRSEIAASGRGFRLLTCDTRVQGAGAEASVAAAIGTLGRRDDVDCVVVIRGGGSRNDLATFDAEAIAVAIAHCPVPVLTGLGHEIDRSVADEVSHRAVKTPTACAHLLVESVDGYLTAVETAWSRITIAATRHLDGSAGVLADRAHRVARRTHSAVERADERLATRSDRVAATARNALDRRAAHLDDATRNLRRLAAWRITDEQSRIDTRSIRVGLLDPALLLARGWSITRDPHGRVVRSVAHLPPGSRITTQLSDGTITSRIEEP